MSVQVNTYILYGVLLNYSSCRDRYEQLEPYFDSPYAAAATNPKNGITVLYDGMNGEYVAIGRVFGKTENHRHFQKPVSLKADEHLKEMIREAVRPLIPEGSPFTFEWHVVSHYR